MFSELLTFLDPKERANTQLGATNNYDSLMNKTLLWSVDCWRDESEQGFTEKLKYLFEQKANFSLSSPQVPSWVYRTAKRGIEAGEGSYAVDEGRSAVIESDSKQVPRIDG